MYKLENKYSMQIKEILQYDWNYAEYIVTDGMYDLLCMCNSVPLPDNIPPQVGMKISSIYAFSYAEIEITKITNQENKNFYIDKGKSYFAYQLCGKIIDVKKALVQVYNFIISLEYQFIDGLPFDYLEGDFIAFNVDRLDCFIELN